MSAPMKTHTEYDFAALVEMHKVTSRAVTPRETLRKKAFYLTWGSCALGIGSFFALDGNLLMGAMLLAGGVYLMVRYLFFFQLMAWGTSRNLTGAQKSGDYAFETYHIVARQGKETARYSYEHCHSLLETEKRFYFVTQSGQCIALDKGALEGGSPADLRAHLERKTGKTALTVPVK